MWVETAVPLMHYPQRYNLVLLRRQGQQMYPMKDSLCIYRYYNRHSVVRLPARYQIAC